MTRLLSLRNRQRVRRVDIALLRRLTRHLLHEHFQAEDYALGIHLIAAPEMAQLNQNFLHHEGSTDVITFDHLESLSDDSLHGEIFICLDDAVAQARAFGTTWQNELARYVIHGLLHLRGFGDLKPAARRKMKREENRLLRELASGFPLTKLGTRNPKPGTKPPRR